MCIPYTGKQNVYFDDKKSLTTYAYVILLCQCVSLVFVNNSDMNIYIFNNNYGYLQSQ